MRPPALVGVAEGRVGPHEQHRRQRQPDEDRSAAPPSRAGTWRPGPSAALPRKSTAAPASHRIATSRSTRPRPVSCHTALMAFCSDADHGRARTRAGRRRRRSTPPGGSPRPRRWRRSSTWALRPSSPRSATSRAAKLVVSRGEPAHHRDPDEQQREEREERGQRDRRRQRPPSRRAENRSVTRSTASSQPHRARQAIDHAGTVPTIVWHATSVGRRAPHPQRAHRDRSRPAALARRVRDGRQRSVGDVPGAEAHGGPRGRRGGAVRRRGGRARPRPAVAHGLRVLHRELASPGRRGALPHGLQRAAPPVPSRRAARERGPGALHRPP